MNLFLFQLYGTGEIVRSDPIRMHPSVCPDPPQISVTVVGLEERRQLEKLTCDLANKRDRWVFVSWPGLNEILMCRCICALVVYSLLLSLLLTTLSCTSVIAVRHCFVEFVCHCKEWLIAEMYIYFQRMADCFVLFAGWSVRLVTSWSVLGRWLTRCEQRRMRMWWWALTRWQGWRNCWRAASRPWRTTPVSHPRFCSLAYCGDKFWRLCIPPDVSFEASCPLSHCWRLWLGQQQTMLIILLCEAKKCEDVTRALEFNGHNHAGF